MTQPPRTDRPSPARRRAWPHRLIALTLVLTGGAVIGWPVAETYANNQQGTQVVDEYAEAVASVAAADPAPLDAGLADAQAYNASLTPASLWDPWGDGTPSLSPAHDGYLGQLSEFDAMGRVRIPQIAVDLPILHDTTKSSLAQGAGHMYGTSLPVGGPGTHAVLAAHTGMKGRTLFDRLPEVSLGHTFFLDVHGVTLAYRVDAISVVEPWELEAIQRVDDADLVTLVTCYTPPGEHQQRLLVRGTRMADPEPAATTVIQPDNARPGGAAAVAEQQGTVVVLATADTTVQQWMVPRLVGSGAAAVIALLMGLAWAVGDIRRTRQTGPSREAPGARR